jgi:hypothetical protein
MMQNSTTFTTIFLFYKYASREKGSPKGYLWGIPLVRSLKLKRSDPKVNLFI